AFRATPKNYYYSATHKRNSWQPHTQQSYHLPNATARFHNRVPAV
ncbi:MAG: hypothetical protein AVDCRST_MAG95-2705, partial [uncultured Adhaeribacter sp.]